MANLVSTQPISPTVAQEVRRRTNTIRIGILAGALLSFVAIVTVLQQGINNLAWVMAAMTAILAFASANMAHRNRVTLGSTILIGALLFVSVATPFIVSGQGIAVAIIISGLLIGAATATLHPQWAQRANIAAVLVGIYITLADLFLPDNFGNPAAPIVTPVLAIIVAAILLFAIFRQLGLFPLRVKLIFFFVLVAIVAVTAVAASINFTTRAELEQQVGLNMNQLAERVSTSISTNLESQVRLLQTVGTQFEEVTEEVSNSYTGSQADILAGINTLDTTWRNAPDESPLIRNVVESSLADELREFQEISPEHVELFITDRYGANIAATNRTSDYYQADEDWWQAAYNNGEGNVYISQPDFDASSQTFALLIAIPLFKENELAGILRSTLEVNTLVKLIEQENFGETGRSDLRINKADLLGTELLTQDERSALMAITGPYEQISYNGLPSLVSEVEVRPSKNNEYGNAISQLGWSVIVHQNLDEALQPVENQIRTITLIALAVLLIAGFLGVLAAQRIAAPLVNLTHTASQISAGDLSARAVIQTEDEIGTLAGTFNEMNNQLGKILAGLEQRVAERTADVETARQQSEKRAQELQAISEISRIISTEQRLETLLALITRLVSERFDFYHVGIFLIDNARLFAVLQAANSEGGQRMLERGHKLEVGHTGIVGNVAQTGNPRIALDVGSDAVYFDNPDLPNTRSEMALPLNLRGQTVGVLDVQSLKPGAFNESDANTLGILADHVAVTIDNARLFEQSQQALNELQSLYRQYQAQEWDAFIKKETRIGYHQLPIGGKVLEQPIKSNEIHEAMEKGEIRVSNEDAGKSESSVIIPVKLRGQTIGVLNIKAPKSNHTWNQDEINLMQAISDRLALALDNARLLQESQRRAAKEQKIGDVTSKIGASINMRSVLQTAVEELGRALPGSEVVIQFQSEKGDGAKQAEI
ncbi:MAG: GAF domain-containing protein [Anaerolineae bacterium]|nr:GAF domain-containing protein [Anaerolineae bacterium]